MAFSSPVFGLYSLFKDGLAYYLGLNFLSKPKAKRSALSMSESVPVPTAFLLGLETYQGGHKTPMSLVGEKIAALSAMDEARVKKYCDATQVDFGRVGFDVPLEGEFKRIVDLPLKERFEICEKVSIDMAIETVANLLKSSNVAISDITHIVTCTCTALVNPGMETVIPEHFGMRNDIFSLCVNFMGCHAGVKTLATATALAKSHPGSRVLFVCSEVCSLQTPAEMDTPMDVLVTALFRDGCAAGIVGCTPQAGETPMYEIGQRHSLRCPASMDKMTWRMGCDRILFFLAREIPDLVGKNLPEIKKAIPDINRCRIAVHPGGPAVVIKAAESLRIPPRDFMHSFKVLKENGNMSSSTIFYVTKSLIAEMDADKASGKHVPDVVMMAFGPGLTTEAIRLIQL